MSVETDIIEIKTILVEFIKSQKVLCILKHEPIDEHLRDSGPIRDKVHKLGGSVVVLTTIGCLTFLGVMSIAFFVVRKVLGG